MVTHLSQEQVASLLVALPQSPADNGTLEFIILRPSEDERVLPQEADVSPDGGVHGDRWEQECQNGQEDQVSVINSRFLRSIAGDEKRMPLSGDNLIVDLDVCEENVPAGLHLSIGTAEFEVTSHPHKGCSKFNEWFGPAALAAVNDEELDPLRLRGLFLKVVKAGTIRVGDVIRKKK
jgi:MOSC domain-containing protein YiiM